MTSSPERALTRIHIEGYRSLRSVDLEPGSLTVLIGANGAGKSNLLSALRMVSLLRTQSLRRFVGDAGGASAILHHGPKVTKELALRLEFSQGASQSAYSARLGYAAGDAFVFLDETVEYRPSGSVPFKATSLGAGHMESRLEAAASDPTNKTAKSVRGWLSQMNFFHFHDTSATSWLRQNARQEEVRYLKSDGSNLAAFLRALAQSDDPARTSSWRRINEFVRRIAPFIKRLEPTLVAPNHPEESAVRLDWIDERDETFGPHHLSDGTLRCIALFTALAQPVASLPRFISVDEPELGLHPAALSLLASLLRSATAQSQLLLATQSPALLDYFEPPEVVVAERQNDATVVRRLEPAKLASWLDDYTLSELYDKNVLGGRP